MTFGKRSEAAAFIAALSRFLASPAGAPFREHWKSAVVWASVSDGTFRVFLSEAALDAASAVFAPLPAVLPRATPPPGSRLVVDSGTLPLGIEQAERLLGE
jgi:hypothetical protein